MSDGTSAVRKEDVADAEGIMVDGLGVGDVGNIVLRDRTPAVGIGTDNTWSRP